MRHFKVDAGFGICFNSIMKVTMTYVLYVRAFDPYIIVSPEQYSQPLV
jgi:hypothetical protein